MMRPSVLCRVLLVFLTLGVAACGGSDTPTSPSNPSVAYAQIDLVVGTGAEATSGRTVTATYTGWLYDASRPDNKGNQFDSGTAPFVIGVGRVIAGWDRGVIGMKVGGIRRLIIPSDLGYGAAGRAPSIPGNAALVFDIQLVAVQ